MSRFFDDILEEEKKEIKKKTHIEPVQKNTTKLSKKEKLFLELQTRVFDLEDDVSKKSEKNIKKFLSDLKKYENSYEELPNFLKDFLLSEKVYVKGNKKVVDSFLAQYEEEKTEEIEQKVEEIKMDDVPGEKFKQEEKAFMSIKNILDMDERKIKLNNFLQDTTIEELKVDAIILLLSTCVRLTDGVGLFKNLKELSKYLNNEKVKTLLKNNLDNYLEKSTFNDSDEYCELLENLREVNPIVCERRILEVEYFCRQKPVETNYLDFQLLSAVYKEDLEKTLSILNSFKFCLTKNMNFDKQIIDQVFTETESVNVEEDQIFIRIIREVAKFTFCQKKYLHSLICFSYVTNSPSDINLDLLCVILNSEIQDTTLFQNFLVRFREFSNNPLVLPSYNRTTEVFRAFYYLQIYDLDGCYDIIKNFNVCWNDKEVLLESARRLLYK